jgi:hypothetical protein
MLTCCLIDLKYDSFEDHKKVSVRKPLNSFRINVYFISESMFRSSEFKKASGNYKNSILQSVSEKKINTHH